VINRLLGGSSVVGAAASSTAGNAAGTQQAFAIADASYALIAPVATIQVAASVIVTALLTPIADSDRIQTKSIQSDRCKANNLVTKKA